MRGGRSDVRAMSDAETVWKFDAWVKFSEGGGGHRTCYVGCPDAAGARRLLTIAYPGSRMDGDATRLSASEASSAAPRVLQDGEVYLVR